jgi:hypothetical protein
MNTESQEKKCPCCNVLKNLNDFYNDKRAANGKQIYCKICTNFKNKQNNERKIALGLKKRGKPDLSEENKLTILKMYGEGIGCYRIAKHIGYSKKTVLFFLNKNVKMRHEKYRKYKFTNENYFDSIDTEEKAYFLGFLWADGCNFRTEGKRKAYQIHLSLQERDGEIVNLLASKIYGNTDIVVLRDPNLVNHKYPQKRQKQYSLRIPSKHISGILLNYGMEPRKSFTLEIPKNIKFDEILWRAFIRGYYDGDGGISFNSSSKNYAISIISSLNFCTEINNKIKEYFGLKLSENIQTKKYSSPMMYLKIHGNIKCFNFLKWLYKDSTIHLSRKYNKYLELAELINIKQSANPHKT